MYRSPLSRPSASWGDSRPSAYSSGPTYGFGEPATWSIADLERRFVVFLETSRNVERKSPDTLRGYKWAFDNFRKFLVAQGALRGPLGHHLFSIEAWIGWNNARGISGVTSNSLWRALRAFYIDLERRDGLQNPFRAMRPPVMPTVLPKARSEEELRRILVAAENYPWASRFDRVRAVAILGTFMYAGLRKSELLRLAFADVDMERGTIFIQRGKGRGGGKDRMAYVSPELRELLVAFLRERERMRVVSPGFFASPRGSAFLSESTLVRTVRAIRRASGVPFSIHSLRHSFVTLLLRSGVPIHVVQSLAGHASLVTTAGYLRCWDDEKRRGVAQLTLRR